VITQWVGGLSYNLPLARHHYISAGLQGGLLNRKVDPSKVTTDEQYLFGTFDPSRPTNENFVNTSTNNVVINSGFAWSMTDKFHRQKAYVGIGFFGMNTPRSKLLQDAARDRILYSVSGAFRIGSKGSLFAWIPNFRVMLSGNTSFANIGSRLHCRLDEKTYSFLGMGAWYNTNKIGVFNLEYGTDRYLLAFAYNAGLTKKSPVPSINNAWEVAAVWRIKRNSARRRSAKDPGTDHGPAAQPAPPAIKDLPAEVQPAPMLTNGATQQTMDTTSLVKKTTPLGYDSARKQNVLKIKERNLLDRKIEFALNSYAVRSDGLAFLDSLAQMLKAHPGMRVKITGHTCTIGSKASNATVSYKRAQSIKAILIRKGIAPGQLQAVGMDFQRPLNANRTESERAKNRRVEFELLSD